MKLLADFHTHTKNSRFFHGKNSIEEMVISANEIGLQEVGITDHGFNHIFKTNKEKLANARKLIDEINTWSKTKVLLGIEADIISEDGTLDIDNETLSMIDILLAGYHKMIKTDFAGMLGGQKGEDAKERATNAFVNAINKYPITVLVHPDSILDVDLYKIGCACRDNGVMVEINNRHCKWTEKQIYDLLASECLFVVSSDAHKREDIGRVDKAFDIIKKYNIPSEYVVNVEFAESERSEADKESDFYYGVYKKQQEEKERKQQELEEKRRVEFSNKLSNEMEDALLKIAKDKGLDYVGVSDEEDEDYDMVDRGTTSETDILLRETQKLIDQKIAEGDYVPETQNEDIIEGNEENFNEAPFDDSLEIPPEVEIAEDEEPKTDMEPETTIEQTEDLAENLQDAELQPEENLAQEEHSQETQDFELETKIEKSIDTSKITSKKQNSEKKRPRVHDFGRIASIIEASESTKKSNK